ncbi:MAG: hypothetical protein U1E48_16135 [Paracoccaceae bacterium]
MAEQPTNLDMFDVLSSIRRLVSEERKGPPPRIEPAPPAPPKPADVPAAEQPAPPPRYSGLPQESRFVLTAALRVDEEAADGEDEVPPGTERAWDRDAAADRTPRLHVDAASLADHEARDLARRTASLEETIAELEAAVADIGAEFEPDGGEPHDLVAELFPEGGDVTAGAEPSAAISPLRNEYQGFVSGFDGLGPTDERLDAPITGEALIPPAKPERPAPILATPPAPEAMPAAIPFAVLRTLPPEAAVPADLPGPRHVSLAEALARADEPVAEEGGADAVDEGEAGETALATEAEPFGDVDSAVEMAALTDAANEDAGGDRLVAIGLADGAVDAPLTEMAQPAPERPGRPQILRAELRGVALDLDGPPAAADEEDGADLFDPLASSEFDVDALRDTVAELVREELRGVLGERITRNLRALVRQEIRKALDEVGRG